MLTKSKIIIGIHGLGNKPPQPLLQEWWKKALLEGLRLQRKPVDDFHFELVYWADILYLHPLNPAVSDPDDPLFIDNPYIPAVTRLPSSSSEIRFKILDQLEKWMEDVFLNDDMSINVSKVTDKLIKHYFSDLDAYYQTRLIDKTGREFEVKQEIRARLEEVLRRHRRKNIMLIGHSMGSIITYDVITLTVPDVPIDTWVTIGSPLGIPIVRKRAIAEQSSRGVKVHRVGTPQSVIRNWYNLSDIHDKIAVNYQLNDDYGQNRLEVSPIDYVIDNDYEFNGVKNPHSCFGYLRTPQMSDIVSEFLTHRSSNGVGRLVGRISGRFGSRK